MATRATATAAVVVRDGPFTVKAYRGDGCVLIAMDVTQGSCEGLAGFALARSSDGKTFTYTKNRLSFDPAVTRGYGSSQAFVDRYGSGVKSLRLDNTVTYDTKATVPGTKPAATFKDMYHWLGARARSVLNAFLVQCEADGAASGSGYDVFAYDLDEPDFLRVLVRDAKRGWPIRMVLDNAALHTKANAREILSAKLLQDAGVDVVRGHFKRYAHDKCIIQRDKAGNAVRVLTGSANFSVRGLYVQSNSVIAVDEPEVA